MHWDTHNSVSFSPILESEVAIHTSVLRPYYLAHKNKVSMQPLCSSLQLKVPVWADPENFE